MVEFTDRATPTGSQPYLKRWLETRLPAAERRRVVVLTGARQVGKTTLARHEYAELRYLSLDDVELRDELQRVRTAAWARTVGQAVLDEAQKEPSIFDKVKYAFDAREIDFTVLLGSSRILLLEKVRESLAGRAFLYDLWPLMLSELAGELGKLPLFDRLLTAPRSFSETLAEEPEILLGEPDARRRAALEHLLAWGGMPGLLELEPEERQEWFRSYQQTFLERDLADLVRLADLQPFRKLQRLAMLRSSQVLSYSELARDAQLGASTARRYLEYLHLTYQIVRLEPYHRNLTSQVIKSPKIFWSDIGLLRQGTGQWSRSSRLEDALFETLVVSEAQKWISTLARDVRLFYYRTRSGLEVDLLIETPDGLIGLEIKNRDGAISKDARGMAQLADSLGDEWLGGLVVHRGSRLELMREDIGIWSMPVHRLF